MVYSAIGTESSRIARASNNTDSFLIATEPLIDHVSKIACPS